MLTSCVHCKFYVRDTDDFCFNCGVEKPTVPLPRTSAWTKLARRLMRSSVFQLVLSFSITTALIILTFGDSIQSPWQLSGWFWFAAYATWFTIFVVLYLASRRISRRPRRERRKTKQNLTSREKIIVQRLSELDSRRQHLNVLYHRTNEAGLNDIDGKLLTAREIVDSQRRLYRLHLRKIELVRVQNLVAPYLEQFAVLNEFSAENAIVEIDNANRQIEKMESDNVSDGAESSEFAAKLVETKASMTKLRDSLLRAQATRALSGIKNVLPPETDQSIERASELFNIQTSLTDFSDSFEELERNYEVMLAGEDLERS